MMTAVHVCFCWQLSLFRHCSLSGFFILNFGTILGHIALKTHYLLSAVCLLFICEADDGEVQEELISLFLESSKAAR